jgi:DNA-binding NarL/FixJ family response regulator
VGAGKTDRGRRQRLQLVGTAHNNDTALQQARALKPDVIVLDLDLEGRSSIDILPQLLQDSGGARVMILSGNRDQGLLTQAVRLGARGVVSKEAPAEVVLNGIRSVPRRDLS